MGDPFMATGFGELKVFSGSAHPELTREIAAFLGVPTGQSRLRRFPDSEVSFQIDENIRGTDVFVIQPTSNPVDHLFAAPVIIDYLQRLAYPKLTMVSPDAGGAERARAYAKRLNAELAIIDKRRTDDGTAEVMNVIGDVEGRTCVLQDDIIDTA